MLPLRMFKRGRTLVNRNHYSTLVSYGSNSYGQAGSSSFDVILLSPQEIKLDQQISSIAAGAHHSAIVTTSGDVFTFGSSQSGQLGLGSSQSAFLPCRIESLSHRSHVSHVTLGADHTFFLDNNGTAYASGTAPSSHTHGRSSFIFMKQPTTNHHNTANTTTITPTRNTNNSTTTAAADNTTNAIQSSITMPHSITQSKSPSSSSTNTTAINHNTVSTTTTTTTNNTTTINSNNTTTTTTTTTNLFDLSSFGHHTKNNHIHSIQQQQKQQQHQYDWNTFQLHSLLDHKERTEDVRYAQSLYSPAVRNVLLDNSAYAIYESSSSGGDGSGGGSMMFSFDNHSVHGCGVPKKVGIVTMNSSGIEEEQQQVFSNSSITTTAMNNYNYYSAIPLPPLSRIKSCVTSSSTLVSAVDNIPYILSTIPSSSISYTHNNNSNSTSTTTSCHAHQQHLLTPCPLLLDIIKKKGDHVIDIAAGNEFYAVLCSSGTVVVWWTSMQPVMKNSRMMMKSSTYSTSNTTHSGSGGGNSSAVECLPMTVHTYQDNDMIMMSYNNNNNNNNSHVATTTIVEINKPTTTTANMPFIHLQASPDKLLLSDGTRTYLLDIRNTIITNTTNSNSNSNSSDTMRDAIRVHMDAVLDIGDGDTVGSLSCGATSYAVVTSEKRLWFWGSILSESEIAREMGMRELEGYGHWSYSGGSSSNKSGDLWCGLRSREPVIVPGLHGVERIALGKQHALVEVA